MIPVKIFIPDGFGGGEGLKLEMIDHVLMHDITIPMLSKSRRDIIQTIIYVKNDRTDSCRICAVVRTWWSRRRHTSG